MTSPDPEMDERTKDAPEATAKFEVFTSRQFPSWLAEQGCSLGVTTYQSGKLFFLGSNSAGELSVFERTFERPMGLYADDQQIWLSTLYTLYRFTNSLEPGQTC